MSKNTVASPSLLPCVFQGSFRFRIRVSELKQTLMTYPTLFFYKEGNRQKVCCRGLLALDEQSRDWFPDAPSASLCGWLTSFHQSLLPSLCLPVALCTLCTEFGGPPTHWGQVAVDISVK